MTFHFHEDKRVSVTKSVRKEEGKRHVVHPNVVHVSLWITKKRSDMERTGKGAGSLWEVPVHQ